MDILNDLANIMNDGGGAVRRPNAAPPMGAGAGESGGGLGGMVGGMGGKLGDMLNSGAMGRIAKSVLGNKEGGFSWLKGALLAGAGTMLWSKLSERMQEANAANPKYGLRSNPAAGAGTADERAARFVRALIYAARADGHIDEQEKAAVNQQIAGLNLGREAQTLVNAAMTEPLDPERVAGGVGDPREALQLYTLSAAVINPDQFMEKTYLDSLGQALGIPDDVRDQVMQQVAGGRSAAMAGGYHR